MANSRGASTARNMMYKLPPKSPFPIIAPPPSYSSDYISTCAIAPKAYRDGNSHHQRASSETTLVVEDQPSWLDELLNEPETPLQRGHRRSSSDSFTYLEAANAQDVVHPIRNLASSPSWASKNVPYKDARNTSFNGEPNPLVKTKNRAWVNSHSTPTASFLDNMVLRRSASLGATQDLNGIASTRSEKQGAAESDPQISAETRPQDANTSSERNDFSSNNAFPSETDSKRAKQQFAQRSRVRKLQYIAELERNVQALQAEGGEVSAELEFLNQQSLILGLENKALKQRLENLAQEQLIKCLEHEVLEREMGRLQALYQQQQQRRTLQQPQQAPQSHRRTASRDRLDFHFANLSLKNKESNPVHDPVSSQPHD